MITSLISVGLFWGTLFYYLRQNQHHPNLLPTIRSIFPRNIRIKRYVRKYQKILGFKEKQDLNTSSSNESNQDQKQKGVKMSLKSLSDKNNSIVSSSRQTKTKMINKFNGARNSKTRQYRLWISKPVVLAPELNNDEKNCSSQNQQKSGLSQDSSMSNKIQNQMILKQLDLSNSFQSQSMEIPLHNSNLNQKLQKYNPFSKDSKKL